MQNNGYPRELDYTELDERYNGYSIEWAISRSQAQPDKWMAHFRALKQGASTVRGSVADLYDRENDAIERAIDDAKFFVDEALIDQGRNILDPWTVGDYHVYGYAVPGPKGGYQPAYVIDRFQGIADAPRIAVRFHVVTSQVCPTEDLAKVMAVSHGDHRVRSDQGLMF